jgi:hypothetical protein
MEVRKFRIYFACHYGEEILAEMDDEICDELVFVIPFSFLDHVEIEDDLELIEHELFDDGSEDLEERVVG